MVNAPAPQQTVGPFLAAAPKDFVTTSLGAARIWGTVGQGILTEVYWPSCGEPQIRDLGFIVAGDGWWVEVKAQGNYEVESPDPRVPLATVIHRGPPDHPYTLTLEVVPDPDRDVLLIRFELSGVQAKVYPFLAAHLQRHPSVDADKDYSGGSDNTAWANDTGSLSASGAGRHLCLASADGFSERSVGYFGYSDLWQDFHANGRMAWTFDNAGPGFVVLGGECAARGTLAIAFADDAATAQELARDSLGDGVDAARAAVVESWQDWARTTALPPTAAGDPPSLADAVHQAATVLRVHEDRSYPGAIVAGLSVPWGDTSNNPGGYHLVWPRDAVEAGFAFIAIGHTADAERLLGYLVTEQQADGHWLQNFFPDGTAFWGGIQLDEAALPVLLAAKLAEQGTVLTDAAKSMIGKALTFLVRSGPLTEQDRWEEDPGGSPFTLGVVIAALAAGSAYLEGDEQRYARDLSDDWNERIEEWCYVSGSWLDRVFSIQGHYVRIGPDPQYGAARIANQSDRDFAVPSSGVLGLEFMYLTRLGLRDVADQRLVDSATLADVMLARNVGTGTAYYRYNYDGYGEQVDGSNFAGVGVGRVWPLLAGERGHFAVLSGGSGLPELTAMLAMRSDTGLLPEQVWDEPPLLPRNGVPSLPLRTGQRTLSAMPLVWAHSELIKLIAVRSSRQPVERLEAVAVRYGAKSPTPTASHWRDAVPVRELLTGRGLVVEDTQPFTLHYGHDDWTAVQDRSSTPLGFGMHGTKLSPTEMEGWGSLEFRRRYGETWDPTGDHQVVITATRSLRLSRHGG